jgi:hypothetical protein
MDRRLWDRLPWQLRWHLKRAGEWLARTVAWHLPRPIVHWAYIRVVAGASRHLPTVPVPDLAAMDALAAWEMRK